MADLIALNANHLYTAPNANYRSDRYGRVTVTDAVDLAWFQARGAVVAGGLIAPEPNRLYTAPNANYASDKYGRVSVTDAVDLAFFTGLGATSAVDLVMPEPFRLYAAPTANYVADRYGRVSPANSTDRAFLVALGGTSYARLRSHYVSGQRATLAFLGDSKTAGWGSGGAGGGAGTGAGNSTNYLRRKGLPYELKNLLAAASVPVRADAFIGSGASAANTIAEAVAANPNLAFGANWSVYTGALFAGAYSYLCASSNVSTDMAFTPDIAADRFTICYWKYPGGGTFKVFDSGGDLVTGVSTNAAEGTGYLTVSRAAASTNSISIRQTGTGGLFVWGIIPYDSTSPRLELWNMGYAGSKVSDWLDATKGYSPFNVLPELGADEIWINLGVNDIAASVSSATYQANLMSLVAQAAKASDVRLVKPSTATDTHNVSAAYLSAIDAVTSAYGLKAAVDYNSISMVTGTDRFDQVHLTNAGYIKEANVAFTALQAALA